MLCTIRAAMACMHSMYQQECDETMPAIPGQFEILI